MDDADICDGSSESLLVKVIDMPWAATNALRRLLALPYARVYFWLCGVTWGRRWRVFGTPMIQRFRGSIIEIGNGVSLRSWRSSNPLASGKPITLSTRSTDAVIRIGCDVDITSVTIVAAQLIVVGDRTVIGANSVVIDTDFHPLDPALRRRLSEGGATRPVVIEDDVFIGAGCLILKGVRLGRGCVIGAGSVVTRDVPSGAIVGGNPARPLAGDS